MLAFLSITQAPHGTGPLQWRRPGHQHAGRPGPQRAPGQHPLPAGLRRAQQLAGARAHYDAQRARGATHHQALRSLANRLVGILHGCLRHHTRYDEATAWHTKLDQAAA